MAFQRKYDTHLPNCISQCLCFLIFRQALKELILALGEQLSRPGRPELAPNSKLWDLFSVSIALLNLVPIGNLKVWRRRSGRFSLRSLLHLLKHHPPTNPTSNILRCTTVPSPRLPCKAVHDGMSQLMIRVSLISCLCGGRHPLCDRSCQRYQLRSWYDHVYRGWRHGFRYSRVGLEGWMSLVVPLYDDLSILPS
jgi:hypothetical protein